MWRQRAQRRLKGERGERSLSQRKKTPNQFHKSRRLSTAMNKASNVLKHVLVFLVPRKSKRHIYTSSHRPQAQISSHITSSSQSSQCPHVSSMLQCVLTDQSHIVVPPTCSGRMNEPSCISVVVRSRRCDCTYVGATGGAEHLDAAIVFGLHTRADRSGIPM